MPNKTRDKQDESPAGERKKRSPDSSDDDKPGKRSGGTQSKREYPEGDYGAIARDEGSSRGIVQRKNSPKRQKAG